MKHTEGKWKLNNRQGTIWISTNKKTICQFQAQLVEYQNAQANAEYICLAVNNHEALVTALQNCRDAFRDAGLNMHADGCEVTLNNLNSKP